MAIRLWRQYHYPVPASFETMKEKLAGLLTNKWFDASKKYRGEVEEDGTFRFKPGPIVRLSPVGSNVGEIAYLKGYIEKTDNGSVVHITISPNLLMVLIMFGLALLFLSACFTNSSMMGGASGRFGTAIFAMLVELFFYGLIYFYSIYLKNEFEKAVINSKKEYKVSRPSKSDF
jgi:hypothetical protein